MQNPAERDGKQGTYMSVDERGKKIIGICVPLTLSADPRVTNEKSHALSYGALPIKTHINLNPIKAENRRQMFSSI